MVYTIAVLGAGVIQVFNSRSSQAHRRSLDPYRPLILVTVSESDVSCLCVSLEACGRLLVTVLGPLWGAGMLTTDNM